MAAWLQIRRYWTNIVPFYLYLVPGLQFVEDGLKYYEDQFKTEILRVPHPSLARMLRNLVFQSPERASFIERVNIPKLNYEQVEDHLRAKANIPNAWVAVGTRSADSPGRYTAMKRFGQLNPKRRSFFSVFDWKIADVEREIRAANLKLPVDYQLFGRSFDGIDYRFLKPIKDCFPADYKRILDWYPLAELEILRREYAKTI